MATTPNYSFSVYSSTDTDVRFLDFRVATAGSQSTSNFYVIDTVLKQHSDAIDSINATPSAFVVKGTYSSGSLYTASVANYPGYKNEQLIVLSLNQKNTGAVQININGTTNKDVMKYGSDGVLKAVDAGDFVANSPVLCLYDGTRFVVIGITSASSITVTGEAGDILQIADDGTIESSGKKAAQPNGIATLDENGNVVQVANMANSAAAVYSGEPVTIEYADENRIGSVTAYGNNSQTSGTTTAPISMNGVDSVQVSGNNLFLNNAETETKSGITFTVNPDKSVTVNGTNSTSGSAVFYTGYNESLPAGSYTLSGTSSLTGSAEIEIKIKRVRGTFEWFSINSSLHTKTLNIATGDIIDSFYVTVRAGQTADNITVYPMLNVGSTALPYEPYNGNITPLPIPRPLRRVGDVRDVCVTRQEYEGTEKLVVTYNVGFVELDGTEAWKAGQPTEGGEAYFTLNLLQSNSGKLIGFSSHFPVISILANNTNQGVGAWNTALYLRWKALFTDVDSLKAYLAAQKAAGTPVQVAYQLATPETYATDPLDIDNTAGPLTVMTGGEIEVRMTELIGSRSDVSNNTVAFSEASQDADIQTGEKLSVLFGKIKKRLSLLQAKADNSLQTTVKTVIGAINEVLGRTKATKTTLNASDALSPTGNKIAYVYTQGDMKTLLAEMSSLGNFDAGRTLFVFAGDLRPSSMICFTGFIDRTPKTFFIYPNGELKTLETSITLNQTLVLNVTYK